MNHWDVAYQRFVRMLEIAEANGHREANPPGEDYAFYSSEPEPYRRRPYRRAWDERNERRKKHEPTG